MSWTSILLIIVVLAILDEGGIFSDGAVTKIFLKSVLLSTKRRNACQQTQRSLCLSGSVPQGAGDVPYLNPYYHFSCRGSSKSTYIFVPIFTERNPYRRESGQRPVCTCYYFLGEKSSMEAAATQDIIARETRPCTRVSLIHFIFRKS